MSQPLGIGDIDHGGQYMPHLCGNASRFHGARRNNAAASMFDVVQERQRPIADWMEAVMRRHHISARKWADKASLGKDTVSRAVRDDYQHVTSTSTLVKLAEAINESPPGIGGMLPSEASLAGIIEELSEALIGDQPPTGPLLRSLASALRDTLLHLADDPEAAADPRQSRAVARTAARAIRRSTS